MIDQKDNNNSIISYSAFDITFEKNQKRNDLIKWVSSIKNKDPKVSDIQFIKFDSILSTKHLQSAVWHAWKSFVQKNSISNSLSIEFILYLSGQRQISKALNYFGIDEIGRKFSTIIFHSKGLQSEKIQQSLKLQFGDVSLTEITFSNDLNKLKTIGNFFDYEFKDKIDGSNDSISYLEKYILSCVSNLVFEG